MPKVSVLMPIYNTQEAHLREAIESILAQTFTDFEFLILNDSPENTALDALVHSYKDKRITYSKNTQNMGITPSRNMLMKRAEGEYFAVMDHDDVSLPDRFEKQVSFLDANPEYGVVSCWVDTFSGIKLHFPAEDAQIKIYLMELCAVVHPASMLRKGVLQDHGLSYEEEFSPSEDYKLWCQLLGKTKFHNIPEVLFRYRDHGETTTRKQSQKMDDVRVKIHASVREENTEVYKEYLDMVAKNPLWSMQYFPQKVRIAGYVRYFLKKYLPFTATLYRAYKQS